MYSMLLSKFGAEQHLGSEADTANQSSVKVGWGMDRNPDGNR